MTKSEGGKWTQTMKNEPNNDDGWCSHRMKPEPESPPCTNRNKVYLKVIQTVRKMVLAGYSINTDSYRLLGLFNEFKRITLNYKIQVSSIIKDFLLI